MKNNPSVKLKGVIAAAASHKSWAVSLWRQLEGIRAKRGIPMLVTRRVFPDAIIHLCAHQLITGCRIIIEGLGGGTFIAIYDYSLPDSIFYDFNSPFTYMNLDTATPYAEGDSVDDGWNTFPNTDKPLPAVAGSDVATCFCYQWSYSSPDPFGHIRWLYLKDGVQVNYEILQYHEDAFSGFGRYVGTWPIPRTGYDVDDIQDYGAGAFTGIPIGTLGNWIANGKFYCLYYEHASVTHAPDPPGLEWVWYLVEFSLADGEATNAWFIREWDKPAVLSSYGQTKVVRCDQAGALTYFLISSGAVALWVIDLTGGVIYPDITPAGSEEYEELVTTATYLYVLTREDDPGPADFIVKVKRTPIVDLADGVPVVWEAVMTQSVSACYWYGNNTFLSLAVTPDDKQMFTAWREDCPAFISAQKARFKVWDITTLPATETFSDADTVDPGIIGLKYK